MKLLILVSCITYFASHASETMSIHLKNAIKLNQERKIYYSELTDKKSEIISDTLIKGEKKALLFSWIFDLITLPYQKLGINVGKDEFISMSKTPRFSAQYKRLPENITEYKKPNSLHFQQKLKDALKIGFKEVSILANEELKRIEKPHAYHCIYRHFLESIIRTSNLATIHEQKAREVGVTSPRWISKWLLKLQIKNLDEAIELDELAVPVQTKNVPILCNDVPYIPPH